MDKLQARIDALQFSLDRGTWSEETQASFRDEIRRLKIQLPTTKLTLVLNNGQELEVPSIKQ